MIALYLGLFGTVLARASASDVLSYTQEGRSIEIMNMFTKIGIGLCLTAALGLADSFSGKLVDANCKAPADEKSGPLSPCAPTRTTTVFSVQTPDGKTYRLDATGNSKAMAAMKEDTAKTNVTVSGSLDGQTLKVESIEIR